MAPGAGRTPGVGIGLYYPKEEDPRTGNLWILNPFLVDVGTTSLNLTEKSYLKESACDDLLRLHLSASLSRSKFWIAVKTEYLVLFEGAVDPASLLDHILVRENILGRYCNKD